MFSFSEFLSLANSLGIMLLAAVMTYGVIEVMKMAIKGETWREFVPYAVYGISFAVYLCIALFGGYLSPIWTAAINALFFLMLESSVFLLVKAVGKTITFFIEKVKKLLNTEK